MLPARCWAPCGYLRLAVLALWLAGVTAVASSQVVTGGKGTNAYVRIAVVAPADDAAVRSNTGNLRVRAEVLPDLQSGHRLQLLLDGVPQGAPVRRPEFFLKNIDRGTHELMIRVVDEAGRVLASGAPSTVHLLRYSRLHDRR